MTLPLRSEQLLYKVIYALAMKHTRKRRASRGVFWGVIADTFALGSTYSCQMVRHFGFNPDSGEREGETMAKISNEMHIRELLTEARQLVHNMEAASTVRSLLIKKATLIELDELRQAVEKHEHAADETIERYIHWIADNAWEIITGSN